VTVDPEWVEDEAIRREEITIDQLVEERDALIELARWLIDRTDRDKHGRLELPGLEWSGPHGANTDDLTPRAALLLAELDESQHQPAPHHELPATVMIDRIVGHRAVHEMELRVHAGIPISAGWPIVVWPTSLDGQPTLGKYVRRVRSVEDKVRVGGKPVGYGHIIEVDGREVWVPRGAFATVRVRGELGELE
jgi:hypothetical protein